MSGDTVGIRCRRSQEKYAGCAGYSLRHVEKRVIIWEDNPQLRELWKWLIEHATEKRIREIPVNLRPGTNITALGLTKGQQLLLKHWQSTNNVGNCWTTSPWGNLPGQWTENTRARVAEEVSAVKHWKLRPIGFDKPGTYFIDPPYLYNYRYGFPADSFDHRALAKQVKSIPKPSQVIVCEAICQKTGKVPDYLPFEFFGERITSRRKKTENHHSKELIYVRSR